MHDESPGIIIFAGAWPVFTKIKFTVDIIFNKWDIMLGYQLNQLAFIFVRHTTTQRVVEIGNTYHSFDRKFPDSFLQAINLEPVNKAGGYLHDFQTHAFNSLEYAEVIR